MVPVKRLLAGRRGDAYAWFAVLMLLVGIPLSSLTIDVVRMMYVRGHLHTATDAACQAAADALDVPHYIASGQARIQPARGRAQAAAVFQASLADMGTVGYDPLLSVAFPAPTLAHCTARAAVQHLAPLTPFMQVDVQTVSEMRVRTR